MIALGDAVSDNLTAYQLAISTGDYNAANEAYANYINALAVQQVTPSATTLLYTPPA